MTLCLFEYHYQGIFENSPMLWKMISRHTHTQSPATFFNMPGFVRNLLVIAVICRLFILLVVSFVLLFGIYIRLLEYIKTNGTFQDGCDVKNYGFIRPKILISPYTLFGRFVALFLILFYVMFCRQLLFLVVFVLIALVNYKSVFFFSTFEF